ncbi:ATP-binding protein [Novosphingobium sp.]|uniref:sensor histidine kinase n=1 Tax=Novosphingobium sp. TaxID=1874826 RepID=UPI0025E89C2F|nr:ATP-binding protein [Novosphingobium sp.]MCC6924463.1 two-component sensor histidine kinase [Novosphingobium sp.]
MTRWFGGIWPKSLQGQLLLAVALALLLAQGISAALLYSAQVERREAALVHAAAIRLFAANREGRMAGQHPPGAVEAARQLKVEQIARSPLLPSDHRIDRAEQELQEILAGQGFSTGNVVVFHRPLGHDRHLANRIARRTVALGEHAPPPPREMMVAAVEMPAKAGWMVVRMPVPRPERGLLLTLVGQTLLLYALLFGAIALILGQITKPLKALTGRLERFAETRDAQGQLEPRGPDDVRRLIVAHNAMEARLAALLDEKDVMLGAIGHDLKTPLAALRVRIESVEDEGERAKMARTIEDITRSLDDILSLARVGRPSDPLEPAELGALVLQVAEEFEDMGEPVTFEGGERIVLPIRATWLRRAVRNLVVNALRYGKVARIELVREGGQAVIRIEDQGPGIPEDQIARMLEPFTRGEPSRNSETGGAGLGLTLARAIADQHGGSLQLANRRDSAGMVTGLVATLALPLT